MLFDQPCIPPNTGNAIRMCANTGAHLHLAGPLGFNLEDKNLKRAGLDYHDLAHVSVHADLHAALAALPGRRVFAFTAHARTLYTDIAYEPGDVLLFGTEPTGLDDAALHHPRVTELVRLPMVPGNRSLNLSNAAAIATFEAWRQQGFPGAH
ncbi:tRNA (cytidine(34)-2'-O)-methyltransferase [Corynebacterium sp. 13CS0277]|uniref:tRNA (cytidine(34)-2'-O)-methyltransferase n=1 Tax=Corynebacterium sp. 13CS0277 TaxID=2071994 RepID=UPI001E5C338B|nr:tRNA (cytidine(34)-2'-O)-methyltransferase [Corynebacterium sp. 13CS0277]